MTNAANRAAPKSDETMSFLLLVFIVTIAFGALLFDFYKAILWAGVLALLTRPLYLRLRKKLANRDRLSASIITISVFFAIILPTLAFVAATTRQVGAIASNIKSGKIDPAALFHSAIEKVPMIGENAKNYGFDLENIGKHIAQSTVASGEFITSHLLFLGQGAFTTLVLLFLTIYLLFFFTRDGTEITTAIYEHLPIDADSKTFLAERIAQIARSTIMGIVVIGSLQGIIGGFAFLVLGFKSAILWGAAIALASLIPAIGTAIVWVPVALWLIADGHWVKAAILLVVGTVIIGLIDNLLRPRLVGEQTKIPDYIVLLSTLGGIGLFGLTGLVLGPMIAGLFLALWQLYSVRQRSSKAG